MSDKSAKILITSTDVMMYQFLLPHALHLINMGYQVDVACSSAEGYKNEGYLQTIKNTLPKTTSVYHISTERTPYSLKNLIGVKELKEIIDKNQYSLIWTNEPVMGIATRLAARAARKNGTKVMYLAHGFHFFKGAPKKNWIYFPIEWAMASMCDLMVMINWEDYHFTQRYISKSVKHIDGIGLDTNKFKNISSDYNAKRSELGIEVDDVLVLSVGELQVRKNHEPIIRAIASLNDPKIKYIICGRGELLEYLKTLSKELKIENQIQFLGHRYDIGEILKVSDIFAHPSKREGLGIAALEAMAVGLPLVTSNIQGIKDYVINDKTGYCFDPADISGYAMAIQKLANNPELRKIIGEYNMVAVEKYSINNSMSDIETIIRELVG